MKKLIIFVFLFFLVAVPVAAKSKKAKGSSNKKVDICHKRGNGSYHLINVSENAVPAHLAHGDVFPEGSVPGSDGDVFGENCEIISPEVTPLLEFTISKKLGPITGYPIRQGMRITYIIELINNGDEPITAEVVDQLPSGVICDVPLCTWKYGGVVIDGTVYYNPTVYPGKPFETWLFPVISNDLPCGEILTNTVNATVGDTTLTDTVSVTLCGDEPF